MILSKLPREPQNDLHHNKSDLNALKHDLPSHFSNFLPTKTDTHLNRPIILNDESLRVRIDHQSMDIRQNLSIIRFKQSIGYYLGYCFVGDKPHFFPMVIYTCLDMHFRHHSCVCLQGCSNIELIILAIMLFH